MSIRTGEIAARGFLDDLAPEKAARLLETGRRVAYPAGSVVIGPRQARPGVLLEGVLRSYLQAPGGRQASLGSLHRGRTFGLPGYLVENPGVTVEAQTDVVVVLFDHRVLEQVLRDDPQAAVALAREIADRFATACRQLCVYAFEPAQGRLARHLLEHGFRRPGGQIEVRASQQELADAIGSVREHVARLLAELRRQGVVQTARGRVLVLDEAKLRRTS